MVMVVFTGEVRSQILTHEIFNCFYA